MQRAAPARIWIGLLLIGGVLLMTAAVYQGRADRSARDADRNYAAAERTAPAAPEEADGSYYDRLPAEGKALQRQAWRSEQRAEANWRRAGWLYGLALLAAAASVGVALRVQRSAGGRAPLVPAAALLAASLGAAWMLDQEVALEAAGILLGLTAMSAALWGVSRGDAAGDPGNRTSRAVLVLVLVAPIAVAIAAVAWLVGIGGQQLGVLPVPPPPRDAPNDCDLGVLVILAWIVVAVLPISIGVAIGLANARRRRRVLAIGAMLAVTLLPAMLIAMTWDLKAAGC